MGEEPHRRQGSKQGAGQQEGPLGKIWKGKVGSALGGTAVGAWTPPWHIALPSQLPPGPRPEA